MRPFAWLLIVAGVLIIIAGPIYSGVDPRARDRRWFRRAVESGDRERVDRMLVEDVRAVWVVAPTVREVYLAPPWMCSPFQTTLPRTLDAASSMRRASRRRSPS